MIQQAIDITNNQAAIPTGDANLEGGQGQVAPTGGGYEDQPGVPTEIPAKAMEDASALKTMLIEIMHSRENRDNVISLLASFSVPEMAVPEAANMIMNQVSQSASSPVPNEIKLGLSQFLVSDLIELGVAAKLWEMPTEEETNYIYQDTVQDAITAGLADKSIDVVELQKESEPLLSDKDRADGLAYGQKTGMPAELSPYGAIAQIEADATAKGAAQQQGRGQAR